MNTPELYEFLNSNKIKYERHDHPAVFTCEEAKQLVKIDVGADTKNLFLRDKKGQRHFLVVVGYEKSVELSKLAAHLDTKKLSMASSERLDRFLGVSPGSVSLLALVNDTETQVELIIDQSIWKAEFVRCHPLINTSTLVLSQEDLRRFFEKTEHVAKILDIPGR